MKLYSRRGFSAAFVVTGLTVAAATLAATDARADDTDITYGGDARAIAMGGAGLAVLPESGNGLRYNPASLAYERSAYSIYAPSLSTRANGVGISRAIDYLSARGDDRDAARLARDFGRDDTDFGVNANLGFRVRNIEITAGAIAIGRVQPNESLRSWSRTANGDLTKLPFASRGDILAAGYYTLPSVGFAQVLPNRAPGAKYNYAIGGRLKYMNGIYTHYVADATAILNNGNATPAPEMNGNDTLTKRGLGVDVGILARPRNGDGFSGALVVNNLVTPGFNFNGTDRDGNSKKYRLLPTTVSLGTGYQKLGATFAADLIDITSAVDKAQFRAGVEQRFGRALAVRAGYSSANGVTYGVGVFGFDVAFGQRAPLEVARTLKF